MKKKVIKVIVRLLNYFPLFIHQYILEWLKPDLQVEEKTNFYALFIKKNDLVFDVGANIGNRISTFLNLGAKVVAVEPQKACVKFLKFKYGNKITIIRKALGEKEDVKEFFISNAHTLSTFSKEWIDTIGKNGRFSNYKWDKKKYVELTTLDNLIKEFGIPEFIKIDVEGYELEVLKGLSQNVKIISIEYAVPEQTHKSVECIEKLLEINNNLTCNYSIGESMKLCLDKWIQGIDMINLIKSDEFAKTDFGDIYIRM